MSRHATIDRPGPTQTTASPVHGDAERDLAHAPATPTSLRVAPAAPADDGQDAPPSERVSIAARIQRAARFGHQFDRSPDGVDGKGGPDLGRRIRSAGIGGRRLGGGVRQRLESSLNADLSGVRVHADAASDRLARSVDSEAFTSGRDIFFRAGAYAPGSAAGLRLLAHEAAHTVQQAQGPVDGTLTADGVSVSDPADRFERAAGRAAAQVANGNAADAARPAGADAVTSVQRQPSHDAAPATTADVPAGREPPGGLLRAAQAARRGSVAVVQRAHPKNTTGKSKNPLPQKKALTTPKKKTKSTGKKKGVKNPFAGSSVVASVVKNLVTLNRLRKQKDANTLMGGTNISHAAIRLQHISGDSNVFVMDLKRAIDASSKLGQHFLNIYSTSKYQSRKNNVQTAQNRTELLGEAAAAMNMMNQKNTLEMIYEFSVGVGIDQIWRDDKKKVYEIVEAKGPGAKLTYNKFGGHGDPTGKGLLQMEPGWVENRLIRLPDTTVRDKILKDCGYVIKGTKGSEYLAKSKTKGTYSLQGRVLTASVSEEGDVKANASKKQEYDFS